ncbi:hypothetical protein NVP1121O_203 [Vibrio phage 1.121.O._10N.286.46.C4]|nr:hypothetical protein NVP1121O_203 [Vibrio phage 1.121.O._10N.286.46.C4]
MELFSNYEKMKKEIFEYFGYVEDWRILPLVFDTDMYWAVDDVSVVFSEDLSNLIEEDLVGNHYENTIYKQRHLPKWVYRGEEYTMIVVDTPSDGNQCLQVFSNSKEIEDNVLAFDY